jgi:hypothetical protein
MNVTNQDLIDFTWFLSKKRGMEVMLREGETVEDMKERVITATKKLLEFRVVVKEEDGKYFVWRV